MGCWRHKRKGWSDLVGFGRFYSDGPPSSDFGAATRLRSELRRGEGGVRIPILSDTCSNPYRTLFRACRTVAGAKRRSEGVIKGCPAGVKVLPRFLRSFGAPRRG